MNKETGMIVLNGGLEAIQFAEWIAENDWGCIFVPEENRHYDDEGLLWVKENKDGVENALRTPELYKLFTITKE